MNNPDFILGQVFLVRERMNLFLQKLLFLPLMLEFEEKQFIFFFHCQTFKDSPILLTDFHTPKPETSRIESLAIDKI